MIEQCHFSAGIQHGLANKVEISLSACYHLLWFDVWGICIHAILAAYQARFLSAMERCPTGI